MLGFRQKYMKLFGCKLNDNLKLTNYCFRSRHCKALFKMSLCWSSAFASVASLRAKTVSQGRRVVSANVSTIFHCCLSMPTGAERGRKSFFLLPTLRECIIADDSFISSIEEYKNTIAILISLIKE